MRGWWARIALLLAALLPSPQADASAVARRACQLGHVADCHVMTAEAEAMTGPGRRLADDPGLAPQLAADLLRTPSETVTTTLDAATQALATGTGTSKAMRDNWCVGFSDRFTVAVWVGNAEGDSMTRVSGTSGAAPVWREVMLALHRGRPGVQPPRPAGIDQRTIRFATGDEPPRSEYFLGSTGQSSLIAAPAAARRPRIVNPVSGAVYALDPDIPVDRQRIRLATVGAVSGEHLRLDARDLGAADASPMVLPGLGPHHLALIDGSGKVIDHALFTVR